MARHQVSDAEILAQIPGARAREERARASEPRAEAATYDTATDRIIVELTNGGCFAVPRGTIRELRAAPIEQVAAVEVSPSGEALHWELLDADYRVPDLYLALLGPKGWKRELARVAGRVSTPRKRRAARKNGAKGGRPRSKPAHA
jgi:Protein of unknown function (DUF2442)